MNTRVCVFFFYHAETPLALIRLQLTSVTHHTPYSKMAATQDGLGRVARKRGIEGHGTQHSQWRPFETTLCLVHRFIPGS